MARPTIQISYGELAAISKFVKDVIHQLSNPKNDSFDAKANQKLIDLYGFLDNLKNPNRHHDLKNCELNLGADRNNYSDLK